MKFAWLSLLIEDMRNGFEGVGDFEKTF